MNDNILFGDISNTEKWVYHYTTKETALEYILSSGKIRLNLFKNLNDPRESKDFHFGMSTSSKDDKEIDNCWDELQKKGTAYIKNHCKILCMVKDYTRPINSVDQHYRGWARARMWAQYSGNHTGVCLIFDKEKLQEIIKYTLSSKGNLYFSDVQYLNPNSFDNFDAYNFEHEEIQTNPLESVLSKKVEQYYKEYFFTKAKDWSNENEWRCVLKGKSTEPEFVSIKESICGIIVGTDFPKVYQPSISYFGEEFSIPIARIIWKNGQPHIVPEP